MKLSHSKSNPVSLVLTEDEFLIVRQAMNEVVNGMRIPDFELRMGTTRERASQVLDVLYGDGLASRIVRRNAGELELHVTGFELDVFKKALGEVCYSLPRSQFVLRMPVDDFREGMAVLHSLVGIVDELPLTLLRDIV